MNNTYIRFFLQQLKVLGMVILGFFLFPFILYPKRRKIWSMKDQPIKKWYFYFSDTSEIFGSDEYNYLNSTYGIYELVKKKDGTPDYTKFQSFSKLRKWLISYHWMVFRNGAWNYILSNKPKQGEWTNVICKALEGTDDCKTFRNKTIYGKQWITWEVEGTKYFRYSFTKPAKWYNIQRLLVFLLRLKWYKYYNVMVGAAQTRYMIKIRLFNP